MFTSRLMTALIAIVFLIVVLLSQQAVLFIAVFVISELLLFELFRATGVLKKGPLTYVGFLPPLLCLVQNTTVCMGLMFLYIVLLFALMLIKRDIMDFATVSLIFACSVIITFLMMHIIAIRQIPFIGGQGIWAVFVGACMSDTFAYIVGSLLGKTKLAPEISPKKTVEGSIGAIAGTIISMLIYGLIIDLSTKLTVNYLYLILLGVCCSVFAQFGDLVASMIKRMCRIKDFGSIFPGHGGFMDRFDSILFVAPVVLYFLYMMPFLSVSFEFFM